MTDEQPEPGPAEAAPGHNSGATAADLATLFAQLPTTDQLADMLETENQEALDRVEALLSKGVEFLFIDDDEKDAAATEFLVKLRARYKASEADRIARKSRFDDLAGSVQAFFQTKILGPLGAAPSNKTEEFDPVTATEWGMGVRITMAQTLYKRRKAEQERRRREAEAAERRRQEEEARRRREEEERQRREQAEAERRRREEEERKRREEEERQAAEQRRVAEEARRQAEEAAAAASRKRNEENRTRAEAEAAAAREAARVAEEAAAAEAERLRLEREQREAAERERLAREEADRVERERLDREEENRLAEERARAEEAAAATTADLSRARGGKGGVSSLREFVDFRDLDRTKLAAILDGKGFPADLAAAGIVPPAILLLLPFIKDGALESAAKDFAKANKQTVQDGIKNGRQPVHGVVYFMNSKSAGRA